LVSVHLPQVRQPVRLGGSIELLSKVMAFGAKAFSAIAVDLAAPAGDVVSLPLGSTESVQVGHKMATTQQDEAEAKTA
jgi:hypothetical protein